MNRRLITGIFAASLALATSAHAVEVKRRAEIEGEAGKVWAKIGGWCAIADWHPAVAKCEESQDGGTARRTITLKDGGVIKESLISKSGTSYTYKMDEGPLPVTNYTATFSVVPDDDDRDEVNIVWAAKFDPKGKEDDAKKVMTDVFKAGIDVIKKMKFD